MLAPPPLLNQLKSGKANFVPIYAAGFGRPFPVLGIGLEAVANMAQFDFLRRVPPPLSPRGFVKKSLALITSHKAKKQAWLFIIIIVITGIFSSLGIPVYAQRRLLILLLLNPAMEAVGLAAAFTAKISIHPHLAVAVIIIRGTPGSVDRN